MTREWSDPLTFAFPHTSIFPSCSTFPRSCLTFFSRSPVLLQSCFAFLCSSVEECMCGGWGGGGTHHTRTVCVLTDQAGQVNSSPHHYPPSLCVCAVGVYWPQAGLGSNSYLIYDPPSTSPLSTRHNCVISPQELEFSIPILSCSALSRSYIKFAFPRTRVPKIPGMRN